MSSKIQKLPIGKLVVDSTIQRALDRGRVAKMVAEFDPMALGTVVVSRRDNGSYHILDGQHRTEAARLVLGDEAEISCEVFEGLTKPEEAHMFRVLNNTAKLQALDKFRVRVEEGEPVALAINDMLAKYGWVANASKSVGSLAAVAACERVHLRSPEALERALATVTRAWGHDIVGANASIVEGLGLIYARYEEQIDQADLTKRLATYAGGPEKLLGHARGFRDMYRLPVHVGVADLVVELYNQRRKTTAIPAWRAV